MKKIYLWGILFLGNGYPCFSQMTQSWDKTIGGNDIEQLIGIQPTFDGGFLLAGSSFSNSSGDKTENRKTAAGYDYWIVKIDASGIKRWDKTIGGKGHDELMAIQSTLDGGFLLGGWSNSNKSDDKSEDNKGEGGDYWIVRIDGNGNILWNKTIGGDDHDELTTIQRTRDGGFLLGGWSISNKSNDKTEDRKGNSDYWIVKIDASGSIDWDKTIGGDSEDRLATILPFEEVIATLFPKPEEFLLGGRSFSSASGDKTENSKGAADYWIVKIDVNGTIDWDKTIGGDNYDDLVTMARSVGDDRFLVGGRSFSNASGDKTENSKGGVDYWVVKIDANGTIDWDKTIGGSGSDELTTIQILDDGKILLGGRSTSDSGKDKTENSKGGVDYWVVKIDAKGNKFWDKTIGGDNSDELAIIYPIKDQELLLGGRSLSNRSGDKTEDRKGSFDYWIIKAKLDPDILSPEFSIYPTFGKSDELFTIETSDKIYLPATLTVKQLLIPFKTVINKMILTIHETVDLSGLSSGYYFVKITDSKGIDHPVARIRIL